MNYRKYFTKKKVYTGVACTVCLILAWAFITAGVITRDFNRKQVQARENEQEAIVNGIILTETKNEQKYWELYGEKGNWDSQNGIAQLNDVIANFYKDNKVSMSLKSSKGTYDSKNKIITLYSETFIVLQNGVTLNADKLTWVNSTTPIIAEGNVKIQKGKDLISTADKIIISPNYDKFKIEGNTTSKVYEDKK